MKVDATVAASYGIIGQSVKFRRIMKVDAMVGVGQVVSSDFVKL